MSICKCFTDDGTFCGKPSAARERCVDHLVQEWDDCLNQIRDLEVELSQERAEVARLLSEVSEPRKPQ